MPLRAKMLSQQQAPRAQISTQAAAELFKPIEGDEPEDVIFDSLYGLRTIALNRPKKLNALNGSMIRKITPRLLEWSKSGIANVIVMKGAGEKAFCAGGDVAALAKLNTQGEEGQKKSTEYFALEYQLDHLIATYNKPYIAFMDGITMGGGVGLSIHAPFRIATERTVFAMPETTIGFFPDVGASFFLPRMAGSVGTYLALTSARLTGANVFYSGIATHYLHSTSLPALESRLAELRFKDYDSMETRLSVINATIGEFRTGLPYDQPQLLQGELRKAIDRCFRHNTISEIIAALHAETSPSTEKWANDTIKTLHERSPTAVHVALRQMRIGSKWSISKTFQREHQIAAKFMKHPDFTEGVTALLIEKREPKWQPASIEDIKPEDNITEPFFEINKHLKPIELLTDVDYHEYPYASGLGVPSEKEVEAQVMLGIMTGPQVKRHFVKRANGLEGVDKVVDEILERKTTLNEDGKPIWVYQE
ncbi:ClpP/crotonase-like domain-containing protein [Podospora appendiculata]|uniref:3-hydroxyisobutyryl-CoA hydrolase n=1 Tax=Podospora appendiculata TaxID=314037 RepID=A0AAE0X5R1_9PEZI|nr:ClpP/crotonase-like domain-containing protein [Podospora appendiculata]